MKQILFTSLLAFLCTFSNNSFAQNLPYATAWLVQSPATSSATESVNIVKPTPWGTVFSAGLKPGLNSSVDIFVEERTIDGVFVKQVLFIPGDSIETIVDMEIDANGYFFITGSIQDSTDFDNSAVTPKSPTNGDDDIFVAKYDTAGQLQWVNVVGDVLSDKATCMNFDGQFIYVGGYFQDTVDFGAGYIRQAMGVDGFVSKYDQNGNTIWMSHFSNPPTIATDKVIDIAVNADSSHIFITGYFDGTLQLPGGAQIPTSGAEDIFFVKYDATSPAAPLWGYSIGATSSEKPLALVLDKDKNPILSASFSTSINLNPLGGGTVATASGTADNIFIAHYNPGDGTNNYYYSYGSTTNVTVYLNAMSVDAHNHLHVAGNIDPGSVIIGGYNANNTSAVFTAGYFAVFELSGASFNCLDLSTYNGGATGSVDLKTVSSLGDYVFLGGSFLNFVDFNPNWASTGTVSMPLNSTTTSIDGFSMNLRIAKQSYSPDAYALTLLCDQTGGNNAGGWNNPMLVAMAAQWDTISNPKLYNWYGVDTIHDPNNLLYYRVRTVDMQALANNNGGIPMAGVLPAGLFDNDQLEFLFDLDLSNNEITSGPITFWDPTPNLYYLDISNNRFNYQADLFENIFFNNPACSNFEAENYLDSTQYGNLLPNPPRNTAPYFAALEGIKLGYNGFTGVFWHPDSISPNLAGISIEYNRLSSINVTASGPYFAPLDYIDIRNNDFTNALPVQNLIEGYELVYFSARSVMIDSGGGNLNFTLQNADTDSMIGLDLGDNRFQFSGGPVNLENIIKSQMQILYLDGNDMSMSGIQPPTSNKPNLTELNISNCQINAEITTMDGFFSALPEIENLDLGENRFYGPLPNPNLWGQSNYNFPKLLYLNIQKEDTTAAGLWGNLNLNWILGRQVDNFVNLAIPIVFRELNLAANDFNNVFPGNLANPNISFDDLEKVNLASNRLEFDDLYQVVRAFKMDRSVNGYYTHYLPKNAPLDIGAGAPDTLSYFYINQKPDAEGGVRRRPANSLVRFNAGIGMPINPGVDTIYNRLHFQRDNAIDTSGIFAALTTNAEFIGETWVDNAGNINIAMNAGLSGTANTVFINPDTTIANFNVGAIFPLDSTHSNKFYQAYALNDSFPMTAIFTSPKFLSMGPCVDSLGQPIVCQEIVIEFRPDLLANSPNPDSLKDAVRKELGMTLLDSCLCGTVELWTTSDTSFVNLLQFGTGTRSTAVRASSKAELLNASPNYSLLGNSSGTNNPATTFSGLNPNPAPTLVALIDAGIDFGHADLKDRIYVNPNEINNNSIDDDNNCLEDDIIGYNFLDKTNNPFDDHGHGTQVSGVLSGLSTNNIAPNSATYDSIGIVPIKYTNRNGEGTIFHATCAIYYATNYHANMGTTDSNKVRVINASWGYYGESSPILEQAIKDAGENCGMLFICAAGNDSINNNSVAHFPSNYPFANVVSVGAIDNAYPQVLAAYSNFGDRTVDLAAVGDVNSTQAGGGTAAVYGTSFATPQVSRAAAMLFSLYPDATYYAVKYALLKGVDKLQSSDSTKLQSGGRLNLTKAIAILDTFSQRSNCAYNPFVGIRQVQDLSANSNIRVYPNPFNNSIQIDFYAEDGGVTREPLHIAIISIDGTMLWQSFVKAETQQLIIPTSDLPAGMYLVKIQGESFRVTKKVVKFD